MSNKTSSQIFSELLEISEKSVYRWRQKDHTRLLDLLDQYFTKEDLQEFLEYGTIEKLEFANFQNYLYQASEFIFVLSELYKTAESILKDPDMYIDYLAYALSNGDYSSLENKRDFLQIFVCSYDNYRLKNPSFNSNDLGESLKQIELYFPQREGYLEIIAYFMYTDFIPFVKACKMYRPKYINLAMQCCIKYILYKYKSACNYENIYQKFHISFDNKINDNAAIITTVNEKFDFEKFRNELYQIMKVADNHRKS